MLFRSKMEMPKSMKYFEMCYLVSLALGVVQSALGMNAMGLEGAEISAFASGFALLVLLILGMLVVFVSRKKSTVGKWILIVLFVLGIPMYIPMLSIMFNDPAMGIVSSSQFLLQVVALYFLVQKDSKQWFDSRNSAESP